MSADAMFDDQDLKIISTYPKEVQMELLDPEFSRQHYSRATYALGCRGPLCRLAETHRGRKRNESRAQEAGRDYKPNLDARETRNEELLAPIVTWHLHVRKRKRLEQAALRKLGTVS